MSVSELISARVVFGFLVVASFASRADAAPDWLAVSAQLVPHGTSLDFTPHGTQPGLFNDLQPSDSCGGCHGAGSGDPDSASTFRPFTTWGGSMMANATRDPLFFAALDVANHDQPGAGDYCLRCHTAHGWYGGRVVKAGFGLPNNDVTQGAAGCLLTGEYDSTDGTNNDFSGASCHFCHRLMPEGPGGEPGYIGNANAWIDDEACEDSGGEPCRRGPYAYTDGTAPPPHPWKFSSYHTEGAICGLCHDVTTPDTDQGPLKTLKLADGSDTGHPFPIERTFSEWQQSDYSGPADRTCQSCHMPNSEDPDATACILRINNRTGNLPVHAFVGGNTWVPSMITGEYSETTSLFGGIGREESFAQTIDWARQMLESAAVVDASIAAYSPPGASVAGSLEASVKVTNLSGHKLPTGYAEGRRMWLNVEVHDANGGLVFESAAYDPATAVLTVDAQARVYETLQGIWNHNGTGACDVEDAGGDAMFHFVLNDCIAKDNRIPPLGFRPATAGDPNGYDLGPVPASAYPETAPGSGTLVNYDTANYSVALPAGTALPVTLTARLYYQTSSREYIEFLRDEAVENGFEDENTMCTGGPNRPFTIGPQGRTRGQYAYELWNNAASDADQPGYGKSPPELMQVASVTASADAIFANGFEPLPGAL